MHQAWGKTLEDASVIFFQIEGRFLGYQQSDPAPASQSSPKKGILEFSCWCSPSCF